MTSFFEKLEFLIFHDKIDELISQLLQFLNEQSFNEEKNDVLLIGNRYNRLNKEKQSKLITYEVYSVEQTKIVHALTKHVDRLKLHSQKSQNPSKKELPEKPLNNSKTPNYDFQRAISGLKKNSYYENLLHVSKNVCRIDAGNGKGYGTGVLIGSGWLLTNNFVLPKTSINDALAQFNYEEDDHGNLKNIYSYGFNSNYYIENKQKWFVFVKLKQNDKAPKIETFSSIRVSQRSILVGDSVCVIQHPNAKPKELDCCARIIDNSNELRIIYNAISFPGSSGSPVFNDAFELIGIHTGKTDTLGLKYFIPIASILNGLNKQEYDRIFNGSSANNSYL